MVQPEKALQLHACAGLTATELLRLTVPVQTPDPPPRVSVSLSQGDAAQVIGRPSANA